MAPTITGDLRIVMLGMTGAGKSATGNTILGKDVFEVDFSPESVTEHSKKEEERNGRRTVSIIDTPGLQDTSADGNEVKAEIKKTMKMSAPGPNVFLLVIRLDERFTEEKKNTVNWIQQNFGEEAKHYTIILFTHADSLKSKLLKDHIEENLDLCKIVMSYGGRYHAFNNEDKQNHAQVKELLDKMDEMVLRNEGKHYTNEMYEEVQRRIEKDRERAENSPGPFIIGALCGIALIFALKTFKTST